MPRLGIGWPLLILSHCWPWPLLAPGPWCASSTLPFSHKCAICCQNCAFRGEGGFSPAWLQISKCILVPNSGSQRSQGSLGHEHHDEDLTTREVDPLSPVHWWGRRDEHLNSKPPSDLVTTSVTGTLSGNDAGIGWDFTKKQETHSNPSLLGAVFTKVLDLEICKQSSVQRFYR